MSWPFLAVVFSGWLYIDAAYRGPGWQRWLFRPLTILLLLLWTWQAKVPELHSYLIVAALAASLAGDILISLPGNRTLYTIGAWFISYLLYTISFAMPMAFNIHWPVILILVVIGAGLIFLVHSELEEELRWPVIVWFATGLLMSWVAIERYITVGTPVDLSLMVGCILLLLSSMLWLINRYRYSFKAANGAIASFYFIGSFMIVRSLHLIASAA